MRSQKGALPDAENLEPGTHHMNDDYDDYSGSEDDGGEGDVADFEPLLESHDVAPDKLRDELKQELAGSSLTTTYDRKSKIINKAIQDIGMGKYQWQLFGLCGFGWLADNLWMQGLALVLPQLSVEFGVSSTHVRYTTMITYVGLAVGSTFWGIASDVIGRRPAFNATLLICGVFGTLVSLGPSWTVTAILFGFMGMGVGGNLPVDGALFLEFLPFASSKLLTLLSVWWPVGQVLASVIAWIVIPQASCDPDMKTCPQAEGIACCASKDNRGWRYFIASLGAMTLLMFGCRFFLFHLFESPKFLLSRGRQSDAVNVVKQIAVYNGQTTWLTEKVLDEFGGKSEVDLSVRDIAKRDLSKFSLQKVSSLFHGYRLAITTLLLWFIWGAIGLGFPLFNAFLPQYLEHAGEGIEPVPTNVMYRNYVIQSLFGVPGSLIATYTVDMKYLGRKGTMAVSTLISGIFLYLFTLSSGAGYQTFCASVESFFQNVMYGVLYAYTPEVFPAPSRGTGTGIASLLNRMTGLMAPIVAAEAGAAHPAAPIFAAGACYLVSTIAMILLPIETRGAQSL